MLSAISSAAMIDKILLGAGRGRGVRSRNKEGRRSGKEKNVMKGHR